jgi:hypothetical protein
VERIFFYQVPKNFWRLVLKLNKQGVEREFSFTFLHHKKKTREFQPESKYQGEQEKILCTAVKSHVGDAAKCWEKKDTAQTHANKWKEIDVLKIICRIDEEEREEDQDESGVWYRERRRGYVYSIYP